MTATTPPKVHRFMDRNETESLINQAYELADENRDAARQFITEHSTLNQREIAKFFAALDREHDDETLGILLNGQWQRTTDEIADAHHQAWDRLWYGRKQEPPHPESVEGIARCKATYDDIDDPKYYDQFGWGYLSGVKAALAWALGEHWMELDT